MPLDRHLQPVLLKSSSSWWCCTLTSNVSAAMAEQLCLNPLQYNFLWDKFWDHPSQTTQERPKNGTGFFFWHSNPPHGRPSISFEYIHECMYSTGLNLFPTQDFRHFLVAKVFPLNSNCQIREFHAGWRERKFLNGRLRWFNEATLLKQASKDRSFAQTAGKLQQRASERIARSSF